MARAGARRGTNWNLRATSKSISFHGKGTNVHYGCNAIKRIVVVPGSGRRRIDCEASQSHKVSVTATVSEEQRSSSQTEPSHEDRLGAYVRSKGGKRIIRRILIANNGMAAAKAILSMRKWAFLELGDDKALQFVAMATPEDLTANAEYIRQADEFVEVPGGSNANNYANVQLIVDIALREKVDAVWPGWGHASENPKLPESLKKLNIQFIGPTAPVMSVLGDKIAANILAQTADVPSIPWSGDGLKADLTPEGTIPEEIFQKAMVNTVQEALESAERIGYPVMLKASEGGGGKGIRKSANKEELASNFEQVKNEVPGSPMFMMQLCSQARHLEVQIVGDEYGNAVALNGRDCTTQRRFQKIFEEGPPVIAPSEVFRQMERAAQRLTQNIGYIGAGTVEYLYNAASGKYFFLELNPRLQVEHPVTEGLTGVNLPATQLQVAMGIPLSMIPEIRKLYGRDMDTVDPIDFMEEEYILPKKHVIAARITAENPDEGFKPTSGGIERVNFQSSPSVWGYFSVGANGGIHEYADSQFGHLFASGVDREEARKALMLALKDLEVRGEIRTAVEYLNQLLETEAFTLNTIDTAWLDGLIAAKGLGVGQEPHLVVAAAVLFRSHVYWKEVEEAFEQALQRGQISVTSLKTTFRMEIVYKDIKYAFEVMRSGPDSFKLKLGQNELEAKVREQSDGTLLTIFGGSSHRISGMEEPLGLRMVLDGMTCLIPTQFDPSECRTDVTGKIVRYLQDDGASVQKGKPFAEVEAMKMIMPLIAPETGKVSYVKPPGSIIEAGDLLATLELANPGMVKKITTFSGKFYPGSSGPLDDQKISSSWDTLAAFKRSLEDVNLILDGYSWDGESAVQRLLATLCDPALFPLAAKDACAAAGNKVPGWIVSRLESMTASSGDDLLQLSEEIAALKLPALEPIRLLCENYSQGLWGNAVNILTDIFDRYLATEELFAGKSFDAAVQALVKAKSNDLKSVTAAVLAHLHIDDRNSLMLSILRQLPTLPQRCAGGMQSYGPIGWADDHAKLSSGMVSALERLARLRGKDYGEVALKASNTLLEKRLPPIDARMSELRELLAGKKALRRKWGSAPKGDLQALVESPTLAVDLLPSLFEDENQAVHRAALEVYVKRVYRAHSMLDIETVEQEGEQPMLVKWSFRFRDTPVDISPVRYGMLAVLKDLPDLRQRMPLVLKAYHESLDSKCPSGEELSSWVDPVNVLHIAMDSEDSGTDVAGRVTELLSAYRGELSRLGVKFVNTLAFKKLQLPRYNTFTMARNYEEDPLYRGSRPTVAHLLELSRLKNYDLERIPTVNRDLHVYVGLGKLEDDQGRRNLRPSHLLLRRISHSRDIAKGGLERIMGKAIDALQLAMLDPRAQQTSSTRLYLNVLPELRDKDYEGVVGQLRDVMRNFITANTNELLKLRVDEIELRLRCDIGSGIIPIRLMASSMSGQWLKLEMYREELNPVTGAAVRFCTVGEDEKETCFLDPYPITGTIQRKRAAARRIGTTYCYDFLGLVEKQLVLDWNSYVDNFGAAARMQMPSLDQLFRAEELVLTDSGDLIRDPTRVVGTNKIGMVAWHCFMKTPEYPEGREIVMIANDCTVQSGSFGVAEDDFFKAASEYARLNGLPRVYIACNSGARIGLVEELKPFFKVGWNDESNPSAGFKYLYLTEEDYSRFPEGTVRAHKELDTVSGKVRMVLTDIIGQTHGIGVENLRGSGMIAGETSRAYTETFTLSYITGRSVGIGAYLCRLGQRNIQMQNGPLILTGYQALNKLLGREVYTSQDQLGGPQVMIPNGVSHMEVADDREGVAAITKWLSFVPKTVTSSPVVIEPADPPSRKIGFLPTKTPYDPRHMLAGHQGGDGEWVSGFFDKGSFTETLSEWGKSVVVGRARLGGIPMGVIAVETRLMEQRIPADPANPESRESILQQAGQVWFPDSAYKTATAIQDFNNGENLPLIIFANWRGFSGGTRDMYGEILKFGAMIVDQLRVYKHPVFIYIPPNGELRGGAWVVVDPTINEEQMEMYADVEARGGILEPPGICEVKYRAADQIRTMHRLDPGLIELDKDPQTNSVKISEREKQLLPLYLQVAHEFADLHDRAGRMQAKGVIRRPLEWQEARQFFYYRVRRRLAEERVISEFISEVPGADRALAKTELHGLMEKKLGQDKSGDDMKVLSWLESEPKSIRKRISALKQERTISTVLEILSTMDNSSRKEVLKALKK